MFSSDDPQKNRDSVQLNLKAATFRRITGDKGGAANLALNTFNMAGEIEAFDLGLQAVKLLTEILEEISPQDALHWKEVGIALECTSNLDGKFNNVTKTLDDTLKRMSANVGNFSKCSLTLHATAEALVYLKEHSIDG